MREHNHIIRYFLTREGLGPQEHREVAVDVPPPELRGAERLAGW
jgi:hypothetical protein